MIAADNSSYTYSYQYTGPTEQLSSTTYPISTSGYQLRVLYDYDAGVLNKISDANSATIFWQLNASDARGNALDETLGNGVRVISVFDPVTGFIKTRTAGTADPFSNRQNLSFLWDANGNLQSRTDNLQTVTEQFFYDAVNRLDNSKRNGVTNFDITYAYNGNVTYRSDYGGGTFSYGAKPHAVTSVGGTCGNCCAWIDSFQYDANGNMTVRYSNTGGSSAVTWYSYNLPNTINLGSQSSVFSYKPDRGRWKQVANYNGTTETTIYIGGLLEKMTRGSVTEYRHYIPAGPSSVVLYSRRSGTDTSNSTYYTTRDHLGSSALTMDSIGATLVNLSYKAFGARRGAAWQDVPLSDDWTQIAATGRHGFTGHEQLDNVNAIHMNGRVYDPQLGRFMSPDPVYAGNLANPQSLNPYSYVSNNPLNATDPSGFIGDFTSDFHAAQLLDNALDDYLAAIDTYKNNVIACSKNPSCSANGGMSQFDVPSVEGVIAAGNGIIALNRQEVEQEEQFQEARYEALEQFAQQVQDYKSSVEDARTQAYIAGDWDKFFSLSEQLSNLNKNTAGQVGMWLATDIAAEAVGQGLGTVVTLRDDLKQLGNDIGHGKLLSAGGDLVALAYNLAMPKYDWYSGSGWGMRQYKNGAADQRPLTSQGSAGLEHDRTGDNWQWVVNSWSFDPTYTPVGPIGIGYQVLGTVPFAIGALLQKVGLLPGPKP